MDHSSKKQGRRQKKNAKNKLIKTFWEQINKNFIQRGKSEEY
jgi:hypothetical protein